MKVFQQYRETCFQNFWIGKAGIGHMRMDRISTIKSRPGWRAGADGFVILILVIAECEIIHGALRCSHRLGCAKQTIGDCLTDFDIACYNSSREAWREHRALRNDDLDRPQASGIHRNVAFNQHAEHVQHCSTRYGFGCIEVVWTLF